RSRDRCLRENEGRPVGRPQSARSVRLCGPDVRLAQLYRRSSRRLRTPLPGGYLDGRLHLGREALKPGKAGVESVAVGTVADTRRNVERCLVEPLQKVEHRAVLVFAEAARDMDDVVR